MLPMRESPERELKVVIVNRSDSTGGAAVVSYRLMNAMRSIGADARMVVCEKLTESPYVSVAAPKWRIKLSFLYERLKIFIATKFNRATLFKIDTASSGLPLYRHPWVKEADVICLNWINQGMLSLKDIEKLSRSGKRIIWTMHDMWCFTGICHHSGKCREYEGDCRHCRFLSGALEPGLARRILNRKNQLYKGCDFDFVAVSSWLRGRAKTSTLLKDSRIHVIPNPFPFDTEGDSTAKRGEGKKVDIRIIFGAARLDDDIKGFPILAAATKILAEQHKETAQRLVLVTFGTIRNPDLFEKISIRHEHLGLIKDKRDLKGIYSHGDIVVSSSHYETLPGTLVEGAAYGCIPVAFDSGGQRDIIDHLSTGYLAEKPDSDEEAAENLVKGILWGVTQIDDTEKREGILRRMRESVCQRFNEKKIARQYIDMAAGRRD